MAEQQFDTSSSRNEKISRARRERRTRRRNGLDFNLIAVVMGLALVAGIPLYLWIQNSEFGTSAAECLRLAEIHYGQGKMDSSLALLKKAERSHPSTEDLMAIATLRRRISSTRSMQKDLPELSRAGRSFTLLQNFESQYLQKDPQHRAACRELMALVDTWTQNYQTVCRRHVGEVLYKDMLDQVRTLNEKYRRQAMLAEPDHADDVLFSAARPTRLPLRRYQEAVKILDRWIAANPDDRRLPEVIAQREGYHKACKKWVTGKIVRLKRIVARGQLDYALDQMRIIVAECALPGSIDASREWLRELERKTAQAK